MASELANNGQRAGKDDAGVKRRGLLRLGTLLTAVTGASAISARGTTSAQAAPGDKPAPNTYVPLAEKGAPDGVAVLDANAKIPSTELPDLSAYYARVTGATMSASANGVAVGNTAAANTSALNTLHAQAATFGAAIVLPPGVIQCDSFDLKASMIGTGRTRTTLAASGTITFGVSSLRLEALTVRSANQTALIAANVTDVTLRDLYVDFASSVTSNWLAFNPYNVDRLQVLGCRFRIGGLQLSLCDDFLIDGNYWDCEYLNTNEPCHISGKSSGHFVNNTIYQTRTDGVDLFSSGQYCVISHNRFYGIKGAAGIECKVTMSDDPNNTTSPGNVFEGVIISNNILRDFKPPATSTRMCIYGEYIDNRAAPAFNVAETSRAIIITDNVIEDVNVTDPGGGIIGNYWGISYTGHNGLITNNVLRNFRSWYGSLPIGIKLSGTTTSKSVGLRVAGNLIAGIDANVGIELGSLERCQIDDNIIRQDDVNGINTKHGVSIVSGSVITDSSISGNTFELPPANSFGIRTVGASTLNKLRLHANTFRDCGVAIGAINRSSFLGNIMDNALNSQSFGVGVTGVPSRGNIFSSNHITMSSDYGLVLTDHDGFVVTGNTFSNTNRAILLVGGTRNGIVDNNVSITQLGGPELPHYSGVAAGNQATVTVGTNKVLP